MRSVKQPLAVLAVAALVLPGTTAAFAAGSAVDPASDSAARAQSALPAQTLVVADAPDRTLERGSYSVEVIAPPPAPEPAAPAPSGDGTASAGTSFGAPAQTYSGENVLAYAWEFVGKVPYGTGNDPSDSFSCDGYVQYVFKGFGIQLPRGANGQAALGVQIPQSEARAGDLLWWPDTHIAIYDGNGGMLDSPYEGLMVRHRADLWNNPIFIRLR